MWICKQQTKTRLIFDPFVINECCWMSKRAPNQCFFIQQCVSQADPTAPCILKLPLRPQNNQSTPPKCCVSLIFVPILFLITWGELRHAEFPSCPSFLAVHKTRSPNARYVCEILTLCRRRKNVDSIFYPGVARAFFQDWPKTILILCFFNWGTFFHPVLTYSSQAFISSLYQIIFDDTTKYFSNLRDYIF